MGGSITRLLYFNNIRRKGRRRHTGLLVFLEENPGSAVRSPPDSVRIEENRCQS